MAAAQPPAPAPILVVVDPGDPFGTYYGEILKAEGLNEFEISDQLTPASLAGRAAVLLARRSLSAAEVGLLTSWVGTGGNLVAMRPDPQLAGLLGLAAPGGTLSNEYLKVEPSGPGAGITSDTTMQFHGTADLWSLAGATAVATLYGDADTPTTSPAVTVRDVGASGGTAAAFTYDLARSVVYTRQGNPAWAGQERDMDPDNVVRSDDMFFGAKPGDVQADWVDFDRITIPQADEQQRLLANLLTERTRTPLPRFWYLPRGLKAAVVLTGDDHGVAGTSAPGHTLDRFARLDAESTPGCSVARWECLRMTSYAYTTVAPTNDQIAPYVANGFEFALHFSTNCHNYNTTTNVLSTLWTNQLGVFNATWPAAAHPVSNRTHCVTWSDWSSLPKSELANGVRLDANYYYWPSYWVQNRPGLFTGSGLPMRFADTNGAPIDVYQAATQLTDESIPQLPTVPPTPDVATFKTFIDTLLDDALGAQGYYAVVTANLHTDNRAPYAPEDTIVREAVARGVPVISAKQLLDWLDLRNSASFDGAHYAHGTLGFTLAAPKGAAGLEAMVPVAGPQGGLLSVKRNGDAVDTTQRTVKGVDYAVFDAQPGDYEAAYEHPPEPTPTPTPSPSPPAPVPTATPFAGTPPATNLAPAPRVSVGPSRVRVSRKGAVKLRLTCSTCTAAVRVRAELRIGTRKLTSRPLVSRQATSVTFTLSKTLRGKLGRSRSLKASVVVSVPGQSPATTAIRLLAPG